MSDNEIIKEYSNGDMTIIWKPKTCIHAAECVKRLPNVYKPKEKPWITMENASNDDLKEQIKACPSGALSYKIKGEVVAEEQESETNIVVIENGPLLVHGTLFVTKPNGNSEQKNKTTAFCRCGASSNKPYCDGAHNNTDFVG